MGPSKDGALDALLDIETGGRGIAVRGMLVIRVDNCYRQGLASTSVSYNMPFR